MNGYETMGNELPASERLIRRLQDASEVIDAIVKRDPFIRLTTDVSAWCAFCGNTEHEHQLRADCPWIAACEWHYGKSKRIPERNGLGA